MAARAPSSPNISAEMAEDYRIVFRANGGPEVLEVEKIEPVVPGPGEIRIRQTAIGLNFLDIYHRTGLYPRQLPSGIGSEAVGVGEAAAPDVRTEARRAGNEWVSRGRTRWSRLPKQKQRPNHSHVKKV